MPVSEADGSARTAHGRAAVTGSINPIIMFCHICGERHGPDRMQEQTAYSLIGGEASVARLCDRFYELMDATVPQFATIRALHPADLQSSRDKLFMFLSGWLGGPDLYVQNIGHPMLRRRHLPFAIGEDERDQWVACMYPGDGVDRHREAAA
jgi:hemoglobin